MVEVNMYRSLESMVLRCTIDPTVMFNTAGWQVQKELCTKIQKLNISTILGSIPNLVPIRTLSIARRVFIICFIWIIISISDLTFLHLAEEPELIDQTNYLADIFFRGWLSNLDACLDIWQITTAGWQPGLDWCICSYSTQIQRKIKSLSFVNSYNLLIIVQPCQIRDCWKLHR